MVKPIARPSPSCVEKPSLVVVSESTSPTRDHTGALSPPLSGKKAQTAQPASPVSGLERALLCRIPRGSGHRGLRLRGSRVDPQRQPRSCQLRLPFEQWQLQEQMMRPAIKHQLPRCRSTEVTSTAGSGGGGGGGWRAWRGALGRLGWGGTVETGKNDATSWNLKTPDLLHSVPRCRPCWRKGDGSG